jgi:hypothetical protein
MEWLPGFCRSIRQQSTEVPRNKRASPATWLLNTALPKIFSDHIEVHLAAKDNLSEKLEADLRGKARNRFVVECAPAFGIVTELGAMKRRRARAQKTTS